MAIAAQSGSTLPAGIVILFGRGDWGNGNITLESEITSGRAVRIAADIGYAGSIVIGNFNGDAFSDFLYGVIDSYNYDLTFAVFGNTSITVTSVSQLNGRSNGINFDLIDGAVVAAGMMIGSVFLIYNRKG